MAPKAAPKAAAAAPKASPKAKAEAKAKAVAKPKLQKEPEEERPKGPPQPDREAFEAKLGEIQTAVEKLQQEQQKLGQRISERSGGKDEFQSKKNELHSELDVISGKMNALQAQKEEIQKLVGDKREEGREMRDNLKKMRKNLDVKTESEIDDRIASIEFKLWTDTITLKDEKKLLQEIQELKRNRPKLAQVAKMETSLTNFDTGASHKDSIGHINEAMAGHRDEKRKVQERMTALMDLRKTQLGDLPDVMAKRVEVGKQIADKVQERNQCKDEFRQQEREYTAFLADQRKVRAEKAASEWQAKQKEWDQKRKEREAEKLDEQPFVSELTLVEQTIFFCKSLTQSKDKEVKAEKKEANYDNPDGTEVLMRKEDREEFFFAPTARGKKAAPKKPSEAKAAKPIKHNAETFRLFDQLKLNAPITLDDIPATLEKLEAQLESYTAKVKEWEIKRDDMKRRILEDDVAPEEEAKVEDDKAAAEAES